MIKNKILDFTYPTIKPFIVEINSNETACGEILLNVPDLSEILSSTTEIFLCTPPNVLSDQWEKTGLDLKTTDVLVCGQSIVKLTFFEPRPSSAVP